MKMLRFWLAGALAALTVVGCAPESEDSICAAHGLIWDRVMARCRCPDGELRIEGMCVPTDAGAPTADARPHDAWACDGSGAERCDGRDDDCDGNVDEDASSTCVAGAGAVSASCLSGACVQTCAVGRADCDGDAASGCEIDTMTSDEHCGACGSRCAWGCEGGDCTDPVQIDGYDAHFCAVRASGAVVCWGDNAQGQLGDGTTVGSGVPVSVLRITDAVQVATGRGFSCTVHATGGVSCWGANDSGELGDGTTAGRNVAAPVEDLAGASLVAAGGGYACAYGSAIGLRCWGTDPSGVRHVRPHEVSGLPSGEITALDVGSRSVCAAIGSVVYCWGRLSAFGAWPTASPSPLAGLHSPVASIEMHRSTACARTEGGAVWCWGEQVRTAECVGDLDASEEARRTEHPGIAVAHTLVRGEAWLADDAGQLAGWSYWGSDGLCGSAGSRLAPSVRRGQFTDLAAIAGPEICGIRPEVGIVCTSPAGPERVLSRPAG